MITVLADDLTGAAEMAGVAMRYGLRVAFGIESIPDVESDVCVVATDSRSASEEEAFTQHLQLTRDASKPQGFLFKKTDSVLRGHVLAEIEAHLQATGKTSVLLQPANPSVGRCIREGQYWVGERLLHETGFATDPDFPAKSSSVKELLLQRSPEFAAKKEWNISTEFTPNGICIPEAVSVEDMAKALTEVSPDTMMAGSAAFFEQVLIHKFGVTEQPEIVSKEINSDFLMICGSTHPQGRRFVEEIRDTGCPVHYFPKALLEETEPEGETGRWSAEMSDIWKETHRLVLSISNERISYPNSSSILGLRMSKVIQDILDKCDVRELLIEGGATAFSVMKFQQWDTLIPVQELAPGVVRMQVSHRPSLYLTIKPGSYLWPKYLGGVES
ncbi:four-carbon acid sugar kinase family protein [Parabacteroides sp. FAFU027]|uniref:four-carbon acid sugar kinase family protein n=1 Tax=Parabacteroides sp. FAFU027 TaxID=2922715 RepID=UPI001FAEB403|nr:four-carbon acid sugar kinase family protein [Parabacteroides sp. FAFU027]